MRNRRRPKKGESRKHLEGRVEIISRRNRRRGRLLPGRPTGSVTSTDRIGRRATFIWQPVLHAIAAHGVLPLDQRLTALLFGLTNAALYTKGQKKIARKAKRSTVCQPAGRLRGLRANFSEETETTGDVGDAAAAGGGKDRGPGRTRSLGGEGGATFRSAAGGSSDRDAAGSETEGPTIGEERREAEGAVKPDSPVEGTGEGGQEMKSWPSLSPGWSVLREYSRPTTMIGAASSHSIEAKLNATSRTERNSRETAASCAKSIPDALAWADRASCRDIKQGQGPKRNQGDVPTQPEKWKHRTKTPLVPPLLAWDRHTRGEYCEPKSTPATVQPPGVAEGKPDSETSEERQRKGRGRKRTDGEQEAPPPIDSEFF